MSITKRTTRSEETSSNGVEARIMSRKSRPIPRVTSGKHQKNHATPTQTPKISPARTWGTADWELHAHSQGGHARAETKVDGVAGEARREEQQGGGRDRDGTRRRQPVCGVHRGSARRLIKEIRRKQRNGRRRPAQTAAAHCVAGSVRNGADRRPVRLHRARVRRRVPAIHRERNGAHRAHAQRQIGPVCRSLARGCPSLWSPFTSIDHRCLQCDYPPTFVSGLPMLTAQKTGAFKSSKDTHNQVQSVFATESSLYTVKDAKMLELRPSVVVSQETCKVCSVDMDTLANAIAPGLSAEPNDAANDKGDNTVRIVSINSKTLHDALEGSIQKLGIELDMDYEAGLLIAQTRERLQLLKDKVTSTPVKYTRVVLFEWMDPLFLGSGWTRELVETAGATLLGTAGRQRDSVGMDLKKGLDTPDVDVVIVCLCGLEVPVSVKELKDSTITKTQAWSQLSAVKNNHVYVVDGNAMFHRPTPRLLDALEWLISVVQDQPLDKEFPVECVDMRDTVTVTAPAVKQDFSADIEECHKAACDRKEAFYTDPQTGYSVMTAWYLKERQTCCGNACRHCPYGHSRVKDPARRKNELTSTVFLKASDTKKGALDALYGAAGTSQTSMLADDGREGLVVMFWSGGKDSFLTLTHIMEHMQKDSKTRIVLLTTIDPASSTVAIQNIHSSDIVAQAAALNLPLCLVPMRRGAQNQTYIDAVLAAIEQVKVEMKQPHVKYIAFGDLFLEDIRTWRESSFQGKYHCKFPLFNADYGTELLPRLWELCEKFDIRIGFSAIEREEMKHWLAENYEVGSKKLFPYTKELVARKDFPEGVDLMGERGEFHTMVMFEDMWDVDEEDV
ncbi:hypothetical protein BC830DRAFT_1222269 [Chytriomyces sp. MP71]|nr:hypothetical protein BC830DRAFT_1222269 [Chytriomyces sp. MP71]